MSRVSTGMSPVTHVADVAVNSAVRNLVGSPDFAQTGRHKIALPVSTSSQKHQHNDLRRPHPAKRPLNRGGKRPQPIGQRESSQNQRQFGALH